MSNEVVAVFDRKKKLPKMKLGTVELRIYLSRGQTTYISMKKCTVLEWRSYKKSVELATEISMYSEIVDSMKLLHEEMSVENFKKHIGITEVDMKKAEEKKMLTDPQGFLKYMKECIKKERLRPATLQRKNLTCDSLVRFGRLVKFTDLKLKNVREYDTWLRTTDIRTDKEKILPNSTPRFRTDVCINNYHKIVKMYTHQAFIDGFIDKDPYENFSYPRGKYKVRHPLTEEDLVKVRGLELEKFSKLDKVRDLFVFCAYTGLAYVDSQKFEFNKMTEQHGEVHYIDGKRVKSGSDFYTPILPPAMEVIVNITMYFQKFPTKR